MNTTRSSNRILRAGWLAMVLLAALSVVAFGQGNVTNTGTGTITNNGLLQLKGALTPATQATFVGTVEFNNGGAQNIPGLTYTNLIASGGTGDKTLTGATTVSGTFTVNNVVNKAVLSGQTLNLSGGTPLTVTAGSFDFSSGTVNYNGDVDQAVLGTTYQNLGTSSVAAHNKTVGAPLTLTGTLTNAAATTLDFAANLFTGTGATLTGNSGTMKTSGAGASFVVTVGASIGGTVNYYPAGAATVADATYTNLTLSGAGTYTLNNLSVSGTYSVAGAGARSYGAGTFTYNSAAALQTIVAEANYKNVTLSLAGLKQITSGTMALTGVFTHTGGGLTINAAGGGLTLGTTASFVGLTNTAGTITAGSGTATFNNLVSNSGNIAGGVGLLSFASDLTNSGAGVVTLTGTQQAQIAGVLTSAGTGLSLAVGTTFTYNGAVQNVVGATYGNLALTGGAKTITGSAAVNGTTAGLTSDASSPVTIAGSTTTTLGTNALANFTSDLTTTGTFDANTNAGTTVTFSGAAQTISGTDITFKALTLSGSAAKISNVNLTANGAFTPTRGVAMASGKTFTANGTVGTYGSGEEVTGLMTVAAASAATYPMNNAFTQVAFTGADGSRTFTLNNQPATHPTGTYDPAVQVNRKITASYANWNTGTATLQLAYKVGEAPSGNEPKLRYWRNDNLVNTNKVGTGSPYVRNTADPTFHFLSLALVEPTGGAGSSYTKVNSGDVVVMGNNSAPFVTIAASADFNTGTTWDEGTVPTATDDAVINTTGITLAINTNNTIKTLTINPSSDLTLTAQGSGSNGLTVTNGVTSSGTMNVNAFRYLTVNAGGYNNQIAASNLSVGAASSIATITGSLTNAGTVTNTGTITVQ